MSKPKLNRHHRVALSTILGLTEALEAALRHHLPCLDPKFCEGDGTCDTCAVRYHAEVLVESLAELVARNRP